MKIKKVKIDSGIILEAESVVQFTMGGYHPGFKTRKANLNFIKNNFGSNDRLNFFGEYLITLN